MIYRTRESRAVSAWIADKRGAFTHGGEVVCPGFHLWRGFVGCPAWAAGKPCSYCFLRTTFRTDPELRKGVAWVDERVEESRSRGVENARAAVETWLERPGEPHCANLGDCEKERFDPLGDECLTCDDLGRLPNLLNAGELADSLGFSPEENPHVGMLLDAFSDPATNPHGHKLLLLTKAGLGQTQAHLSRSLKAGLAGREPSENVILSWSVANPREGEPHWGSPWGPGQRIHAAVLAMGGGWRVRLRLDPLIDHGHHYVEWNAYAHGRLVGKFGGQPELVTLGTLRHRGGRPKLPAEERMAIYREAIAGLRDGGYEGEVGLCKETREMIREVLGIEPEVMRCNCAA